MNKREKTLKVIAEGLGRREEGCPVVGMLAEEVVSCFNVATDASWDVTRALHVLVTIEDLHLRDKTEEAIEVIRSAFEQMDELEAISYLDMLDACGKVNRKAKVIFVAKFLEMARYLCLFSPYGYSLSKVRGEMQDDEM